MPGLHRMQWPSLLLLCGWLSSCAAAAEPDETDRFFQRTDVPTFRLELAPPEVDKIREGHRPYARAAFTEVGQPTVPAIGVKLKGAAGSFRDFDDRPALTLNADKFRKKQRLFGMDKLHLNNSVQDEGYLHEQLCAEICRRAGYPAPRISHALVVLNDRDVGLYVVKEGFDPRFLKRHFRKDNGNLYDGGFLQDLDAPLEKDEGDGPDDHSDLHAIAEALRNDNPQERWQRLAELVDMDRFYSFMALERLMCHWDGYCNNRNNYRVYFDPETKRAVFLPHGMDQMFGDPGFGLFDFPEPMVSAAVMQNNTFRQVYRKRVQELSKLFVPADPLVAFVEQSAKKLRPVFEPRGEDAMRSFNERVQDLKNRLVARAEHITRQLSEPDPEPETFNEQGLVELRDWWPVGESEEIKLEAMELPDSPLVYRITNGPTDQNIGSWRKGVLLGPGRYQFTARCRTRGLEPLAEGPSGVAIGVSRQERTLRLPDGGGPHLLKAEFEVREDRRQVELVAEMRVKKGTVWFEANSMQLQRLSK